jgi:hypothetical protein
MLKICIWKHYKLTIDKTIVAIAASSYSSNLYGAPAAARAVFAQEDDDPEKRSKLGRFGNKFVAGSDNDNKK